MSLTIISTVLLLLAATPTPILGFTTFTSKPKSSIVSSLSANVLAGKEIENDFTPINNMILVRKSEIIDKTEGGIFLTGKEKIDKSAGVVVSTGDGRINTETGFQSPMPISIGDTVYYGKFTGEDITYNGAKHALIRDDDVLVRFPAGSDETIENAEVTWDSVLVKVVEKNQEETGSILIAKTVKKTSVSSIAEVLKVGPGRYAFNGVLMGMDVAPGDMVKYRDYAVQEVEINGEKYAVVRMNDLFAKF